MMREGSNVALPMMNGHQGVLGNRALEYGDERLPGTGLVSMCMPWSCH